MTLKEIGNYQYPEGSLYVEFPYLPNISVGPNQTSGIKFETVTVLNPKHSSGLMEIIKYLQEGENYTRERAKLAAIYKEEEKAVEKASLEAEDLFEETNIEIDGEVLYRRVK